MLKFRNVTNDDYDWAKQLMILELGDQQNLHLRFLLEFSDIFKLLKIHFLFF